MLRLSDLAIGWAALRRPLWLFDPRGLTGVYANPAALALWGADSLAELLGRDFSGLSPAVLARTRRLAQDTAGGRQITEPWTFYPKGRPVTVQATISTIELADPGPVLMFEAAPAEIEPAERRAVEALRHASTVISLFDAAGAPLFANPAAFADYGSLQLAFASRFRDPAAGQALFDRALAGETVADILEVGTSAGPRWRHVDLRPVLDPVSGSGGVLLNETDVTARVEAEAARAAAEQKAAMAQARERFLGEMSHELRTPLNAVIGFSDLMIREPAADRAEGYAREIHAGGLRLLQVVNEMIALADGTAAPAASTAAGAGPAVAGDAPGEPPLRVLYVDDNPANRTLLVAMLEALGLACATASDGAEGLAAAQGGAWDLILMDIQMPVMDGVAAARAIRALPGPAGRVPILALTANTSGADLARYTAAGMDGCLGKPVQMTELAAALSALGGGGRSAAPEA